MSNYVLKWDASGSKKFPAPVFRTNSNINFNSFAGRLHDWLNRNEGIEAGWIATSWDGQRAYNCCPSEAGRNCTWNAVNFWSPTGAESKHVVSTRSKKAIS